MTRLIMCANCDAEIGLGFINGICKSVCHQWYNKCANDLFCENPLDQCDNGKPLNTIVQDQNLFCTTMGYPVSDKPCWDGTPVASRFSRQVNKWNLGNKKNMGIVDFNFYEYVVCAFNILKAKKQAVLIAITCIVITFLFFYGLYRFN